MDLILKSLMNAFKGCSFIESIFYRFHDQISTDFHSLTDDLFDSITFDSKSCRKCVKMSRRNLKWILCYKLNENHVLYADQTQIVAKNEDVKVSNYFQCVLPVAQSENNCRAWQLRSSRQFESDQRIAHDFRLTLRIKSISDFIWSF